MQSVQRSFVSGVAFLVGYLLPALAVIVWSGWQAPPAARGSPDVGAMLYLVGVQAVIGGLIYAILTGLARHWTMRSTRTRVTVSVIAGAVAYVLSWTGLVALGFVARGIGSGSVGGFTEAAGWALAAWPGIAAGVVVLLGSMVVSPPRTPAR